MLAELLDAHTHPAAALDPHHPRALRVLELVFYARLRGAGLGTVLVMIFKAVRIDYSPIPDYTAL